MTKDKRTLPPWLLGLIIAVVIFVIGFLVYRALGFGDDPVIGDAGMLVFVRLLAIRSPADSIP